MEAAEATALCVRFHLGALRAQVVDDQLERFGQEVLPALRTRLARAR